MRVRAALRTVNLQTCLVWPSQYSQAAPTGRKRSFSKRRSCSKLGLLSSGVGGQITAFSCAGSGSRHAAGAAQPRREWRGNAARGVPSARPPRRRLLRAPLFLSSNMKCRKSAGKVEILERQDKIRRRAAPNLSPREAFRAPFQLLARACHSGRVRTSWCLLVASVFFGAFEFSARAQVERVVQLVV